MKNQPTLSSNISSRYHHARYEDGKLKKTVCILSTKNTEGEWIPLATGEASVSPTEPSPSKEMGRVISFGRAYKQLPVELRND